MWLFSPSWVIHYFTMSCETSSNCYINISVNLCDVFDSLYFSPALLKQTQQHSLEVITNSLPTFSRKLALGSWGNSFLSFHAQHDSVESISYHRLLHSFRRKYLELDVGLLLNFLGVIIMPQFQTVCRSYSVGLFTFRKLLK